jgi:hypothetical protein
MVALASQPEMPMVEEAIETDALVGQDEPRVHKWTVEEYYKMGEAGLFR